MGLKYVWVHVREPHFWIITLLLQQQRLGRDTLTAGVARRGLHGAGYQAAEDFSGIRIDILFRAVQKS